MLKTEFISIILVNFNNSIDTIECIQSLLNIYYSNFKIIVVDNSSNKNDLFNLNRFIDLQQEKITLIISDSNSGFASACNIGIKKGIEFGSEFILLLNNDTIVTKNFLNELVGVFSKSFNYRSIGVPKICYYPETKIVWYAGGYVSKIRASGFHKGINKPALKFKKTEITQFATGCCMLIPKSVINEVGLLDERYFLYQEDVDYSIRLGEQGISILFQPRSIVYHKIGAASKKDSGILSLYYNTRNRLYISQKYFPHFFYITFFLLLLSFTFKSVYWLIKGDIQKLKIIFKAFIDFKKGVDGKVHYFN